MSKVALIDTIPIDARNQGSINLGLAIVSKEFHADVFTWRDEIPPEYTTLAYNIYYPMNIINFAVSLNRNGGGRKVIVGGQGVSNIHGLLDCYVDEIYQGELDNDTFDKMGWYRQSRLQSEPVIKRGKAVVELTRGCKYRCTFCEYGHVFGGSYREKSLFLVKSQIDYCVANGVRSINFLSANFAGYTKLDELMEYCAYRSIRILNSDMCILDIKRIIPWLEQFRMRTLKLGIESFDEATRLRVKKPMSDVLLESTIDVLLEPCNCLHFYLIYGLPSDNYQQWCMWLEKLAGKREDYTFLRPHMFEGNVRQNTKNIRFEFSVTNFEPCLGTPLQDTPCVDFKEKDSFLQEWLKKQIDTGFIKSRAFPEYKTAHGRIGRMKNSYELLMALKRSGNPKIIKNLLAVFPHGVGRSVEDVKAGELLKSL